MRLTQEEINQIISRLSGLKLEDVKPGAKMTSAAAQNVFQEVAALHGEITGNIDGNFEIHHVTVAQLMARLERAFGPCAEPPADESNGQ